MASVRFGRCACKVRDRRLTTTNPLRTPNLNVSDAALIAVCMLTYVTASRVLGENYPFGPLSMFSERLLQSTRIVGRTTDGRLCEIDAFESWDCPQPVDLRSGPGSRCGATGSHAETDRKVAVLIGTKSSPRNDVAAVDVVRLTFAAAGAGRTIATSDCTLLSCTATERPGKCRSIP